MKSYIILGLVGVCTVLIAGNTASAVVGGGNGYGKKKHKFHIKNMEPHKQVCVWMRPKGTKRPKSHREWKANWMKIDGKGSAHAQVKGGWCECTVIDKGTKKNASKTWLVHMNKDKNYCCDSHRIWEDGKRPPRNKSSKKQKSRKSRKGKGGKGGHGSGNGSSSPY